MFIPMATPEEEPYQLVPSDWQGCVVKQPVLEGIWTFLFFLMPCAFQSVKPQTINVNLAGLLITS